MFQEKTATLEKANDIIKGVIQSLKEARSNEGFNEIWKSIQSFAEKYNLSLKIFYEKESKYSETSITRTSISRIFDNSK